MIRTVYSAEHEAFRTVIRDFVATEVTPHFAEWGKAGRPPRGVFHQLGALGITGFEIPEQYGGAGEVGHKYEAIVSEETARAAVSLGHYNLSTGIVLPYLLRLATDDQKRRWFPGIAAGDIMLCIAMTEPGTGSDLAGIRTTARRTADGRDYLLNGAKTFISGARNSELCLVVARTSPATANDRRAGLSLLVVPTDSPGFCYGRSLDKIGLHSSDTHELSFNDVHVPAANLLGAEGEGFRYLGQNLPRERLAVGVSAVASTAAAIRLTRDYVNDRTVFGRPVAAYQNTRFVLAECDTEVAAAQALVDRALDLEESGELTGADAARVKLLSTEVAGRVIGRCLQLHGGYGYVLEYPIARLYADIRVNRIYAGTSEVMKAIIAKDLGMAS
ncbi:MAG TPA: acyl-CoA dehydrogenase family protein [Nakamurella sp.]